jgi:hypothetical protein
MKSLPEYYFFAMRLRLILLQEGFWRKRLRPLNPQQLSTTRQVAGKGRSYLYGISFVEGKSGCILIKDRICPQTKGPPFAIHSITIGHSHLKTGRMTFGSLNASNQGCDIEIALSFRTFPHALGCSH